MNTHAGYSKTTLTDTNVLLAGGGDKSLADFLGGIQYVSASNKIQYRAANTNTWTDLVTLVMTDENVKQTPKTDNINRPLMMINGSTSTGTLTSTSMFSTGIYANASTKMITAAGFIKTGSDNTHVLLGGGGHALAGHSNNDSPYIPIADGTVCSTLNADMLDGYHANTVYQVATHTINNANTSNTWKRIATITISGTGLSIAGFTAIFSNRECLDNTSFILTLGIRRNNTTSAAGISFYYTALQGSVPRTITVRSDDNQTFYVYFQSVANTYTTYYNVTKIMTEGNVKYENVGLTSIIDGTLTNKNALKGGNVNLADTAAKLATERTISLIGDAIGSTTFDGSADASISVSINDMIGATDSADGTAGFVPAPPSDGYNTKFLKADGTWKVPDYPTVNNASLTLQTAGTTLTTFYANDSTNRTFNVTCENIGAATSGHNHDGRYVQDYGSSITVALYDIPTKHIFSGNNVTDGPTTGWISGLVLGSNWNNNHYLHFLVENGSRWYATRSYANNKMKDWNTFAYLTDIKWSLLADKPATATRWPTWNEVTNKPSTFTPSAHTHAYIKGSDNRSTNNEPSWYMSNIGSASVYTEFALTGGANGNYENRVTFTPWGDSSGQRPVQLAFNNSGMFIRTSSSDSAWNGWYKVYHSGNLPSFAAASHTHPFSQITDGTSSSTASGWSHILSNTYGGSLKSILYMCHGGGYGMHLRGYSTSASVYMLLIYNSSSEVFGVYGDGHSVFGGNVTGTNFYTTSDRNKKTNISSFSEHIRKFQLKDTEKYAYGVIAQEVEEMFRSGEEGNMTVNYNSVLSYYIGLLELKVLKLEERLSKFENLNNIN